VDMACDFTEERHTHFAAAFNSIVSVRYEK
jgi:hypothetical protein